jgi:dolichol-phosphate mannosyltransferase
MLVAPQSSADVSIVVPFYNEAAAVCNVLEEISAAQPQAEVIAVDDGSTDATWARICSCRGVRGIHFEQNLGQSAAMVYGLRQASRPWCATMDGDGQNNPADFSQLMAAIAEGKGQVAVGRRLGRKDDWSRRYASRFANGVRRCILNDGVEDTGCSLKVFPKSAVEHLLAFNGQHRYMPAVFLHAGYTLCQVDVSHRARSTGTSKYTNWDRALRGIFDLIGMRWLLNRKIIYPETIALHQPASTGTPCVEETTHLPKQ